MTVLSIDDDLEYYDVLLGLGSVNVKPKVGSNCLIGFINNSETLPFLIMADEVEEIDIKKKALMVVLPLLELQAYSTDKR